MSYFALEFTLCLYLDLAEISPVVSQYIKTKSKIACFILLILFILPN